MSWRAALTTTRPAAGSPLHVCAFQCPHAYMCVYTHACICPPLPARLALGAHQFYEGGASMHPAVLVAGLASNCVVYSVRMRRDGQI